MQMNEHGGILSKIFIIPAGVVVILSVFLLGYYVGKSQPRDGGLPERPPALPDIVSEYLPKKEDLTFYRTLTEKGDKTLSIDLKPKPKSDEPSKAQKEPEPAAAGGGAKHPEERTPGPKAELVPKQQRQAQPAGKKNDSAAASSGAKGRFTVQAGSYPEKHLAEEEVRNLKRRGYVASIVATDIPEKGTWYRVRIGSFSQRQAAEKLAAELKTKEGIASFIAVE